MPFVPGIRSEEQLQGIWETLLGGIALPSGAATLAEQQLQTTQLLASSGSLSNIEATLGAFQPNLANLAIIVTTAHLNNAIFGRGVPAMGQLDDVGTTAATENNVSVARITAQRAFHVNLRSNNGSEAGIVGNPVSISGTVTANMAAGSMTVKEDQPHVSGVDGIMSFAVRNDSLGTTFTDTNGDYSPISVSGKGALFTQGTDGTNFMPTMDVGARSGFQKIYDGSGLFNVPVTVINASGFGALAASIVDPVTLAQTRVFSTGEIAVIVGSTNNTMAGSGYLLIDAQRNTLVAGRIAHDGVDADGPIKTGYRARTTRTSSIAVDDRSDITGDRQGQQWIDSSEFLVASATSTTSADTQVIAAPGSNLKIVVYNISISGYANDADTSGATAADKEGVEFRFGGGSYFYQTVWQTASFEPNSGRAINLAMNPTNIPLQHGHWDGGSNQAFNVKQLGIQTTVGCTFYVNVAYRIMPT